MQRIPLAIPNVGEAEAANLQKCIDDNFVSTVGPFVTQFEEGVAARHGSRHASAVAAGTMGLHLSLLSLGVGRDDLVLCPSFTFIATANAIAHASAMPWFVDIDPGSWSMSVDALRTILAEETERDARGALVRKGDGRRVAAIMPVYTLGTVAEMDAIGEIAREYGLPVIADAAAAIGVTFKGQPIGPLADLTVFSFNGNKTITTGGGGMVIGEDAALMARVKHLATTARVSPNYEHDEVGYNYRMTNLEAAVGCAQLGKLDAFIRRKQEIRAAYDEGFADISSVTPFPLPGDRGSTCWFSGLVFGDDAEISVQNACAALGEEGIEARPFWKPVHLQAPFAEAPCGSMAHTEDLWGRILTLPCSTLLTDSEQARVINAVRQILKH